MVNDAGALLAVECASSCPDRYYVDANNTKICLGASCDSGHQYLDGKECKTACNFYHLTNGEKVCGACTATEVYVPSDKNPQ